MAAFTPITVGKMQLTNRIALAPLTRFRNSDSHAPKEISAEYYRQRASYGGTALITEATVISPEAGHYKNAPGIYTDEQVEGWKNVVDKVHGEKSFLIMQLWALGRAADPEVLKSELPDADVVSASNIPFEGGPTPRALTKVEIQQYVADYAKGAKRFIEEAGGDAVEIHGANGYLLDQFLQTTCNDRTDDYGGSVENRARFLLDTIDAVVAAVGAEKVGFRLSPYSTFQGMKMPLKDIHETFSFVVKRVVERYPNLAYIHAVESRIAGNTDIEPEKEETLDFLRDIWAPRPFFVAGGFTDEHGPEVADKYENNVVVYGRYFISNPDLVHRLKEKLPLTKYDRDTFYLLGPNEPRGYIDYPFADGHTEGDNLPTK